MTTQPPPAFVDPSALPSDEALADVHAQLAGACAGRRGPSRFADEQLALELMFRAFAFHGVDP